MENKKSWEKSLAITAIILAIFALFVSGISLYFAEFRKATIRMSPITDLAIHFVKSDIVEHTRPMFVPFVSLNNSGSKPAWVDNIVLQVRSNSKNIEMVCVGWFSVEKFAPILQPDDFRYANYPKTIEARSNIALAPYFATNLKDELVPQVVYNATLRIKYSGRLISQSFDFKIPGSSEIFQEKSPGSITRFAPIGVERKYIKITTH